MINTGVSSRYPLILLAVAALLALASSCTTIPLVSAPDRTTGCSPYTYHNTMLQNDQPFSIPGGECGGVVVFDVHFDGYAQFPNAGSGDRKAEAAVTIRETSNNNVVKCSSSDAVFNTFHLRCYFGHGVAPHTTSQFMLRYDTNNVGNRPLPTLDVRLSYYLSNRRQ